MSNRRKNNRKRKNAAMSHATTPSDEDKLPDDDSPLMSDSLPSIPEDITDAIKHSMSSLDPSTALGPKSKCLFHSKSHFIFFYAYRVEARRAKRVLEVDESGRIICF